MHHPPSAFSAPSSIAVPSTVDASLQSALHALQGGDFQLRWEAAKTLSHRGIEIVPTLLNLVRADQLEAEDWELPWFVARILGDLKHPVAIEGLIHLLYTTPHLEVVNMAAMALAHTGTMTAPLLSQFFAATPPTDLAKRQIAIQALAQIQHPVVIPTLLEAAQTPSAEMRTVAIEVLGQFARGQWDLDQFALDQFALDQCRFPEVATLLQAALQDPVASVRRAAVMAIGRQVDPANGNPQVTDIYRYQQGHRTTDEWVQSLEPLLQDADLTVCCQTAIALGRMGSSAFAPLQTALLAPHTPPSLRVAIIHALIWSNAIAALTPLQHWLNHISHLAVAAPQSGASVAATIVEASAEDPAVASPTLEVTEIIAVGIELITSLGRVDSVDGQQAAVEMLLSLWRDRHPLCQTSRGKQALALSLGQLGQLTVRSEVRQTDRSAACQAVLIALLADADTSVQLHAIAALKHLTPSPRSQLQQQLQDPTLPPALQRGLELALQEWPMTGENEPTVGESEWTMGRRSE